MPETERPESARVSLEDATIAWRVLLACAANWPADPRECGVLIEARRLVEMEVREQHGDEAWRQMVGDDDEDDEVV